MASLPGTQTLRFRGPNDKPKPQVPKYKHDGILQDQVRRTAKLPWSPTFAFALRMILLVRVSAAMYSNIDDCDEVYNFWEPLHFFDRGHGFQTWETSPQFAIRSWAYILLHLPPTIVARFLAKDQKRAAFFAVRIFLAVLSSLSEVTLYRKVYEKVNHRVGRYLFFILLFNAGMWNASAAFLPSSFAMYTGALAFAYSIIPSSSRDPQRTLFATLLFASGAIVGWPFALALAIPFVIEELFVFSGDKVPASARSMWMMNRWKRLFGCGALAALIFIPVVGIDSLAYGRLAVVPFNIVKYNILSSERGPELYGTSPWHFYILNLLLNFNVIFPFALLSLPALAVTFMADKNRLGVFKGSPEESSPFTILALRLSPFYLWLAILTAQPHKEERFMFPAYPMLCFNAAVTVYLVRGWMETAFIAATKSPYRASRSSIFSTFTLSVLTTTAVFSASRIAANWKYYHAPLAIANHFEAKELPHILTIAGILPEHVAATQTQSQRLKDAPRVDLAPIKDFNLTLCYGKEWYRFVGHYLVPDGVRVEFIQSDFEGLLPGHFSEGKSTAATPWWARPQTRIVPQDQNDLNQQEHSHYVPVSSCTHLIDLDYPSHTSNSSREPRYAVETDSWDRVECQPFLDAQNSPLLSRVLWAPGEQWRSLNTWGDYCLLRNRALVADKMEKVKLQLEDSKRQK
ncbi:glycosyltransferase family 22 protein [Rhodocollybia butyracea]|uniref:Mannosyltransferase n=1 Tax=Rhodocollybia butyracea TaxID=206335 RepID=A0A9P5Q5Q7_9AGAR|nr:glycosyltransferase family 22 protein [Rhodocollybia butyracea]